MQKTRTGRCLLHWLCYVRHRGRPAIDGTGSSDYSQKTHHRLRLPRSACGVFSRFSSEDWGRVILEENACGQKHFGASDQDNGCGMALVTPDAEESLLSLMVLVKHSDGSFSGDRTRLTIKDGSGNTVLVATNNGDDFCSCFVVALQLSYPPQGGLRRVSRPQLPLLFISQQKNGVVRRKRMTCARILAMML